ERSLELGQRGRDVPRPEPQDARRREEAEHVELELDRPDLDRRNAGGPLERLVVDLAEKSDRDVEVSLRGRPPAGQPHDAAARTLDRAARRIVGPQREKDAPQAAALFGFGSLAHSLDVVLSP